MPMIFANRAREALMAGLAMALLAACSGAQERDGPMSGESDEEPLAAATQDAPEPGTSLAFEWSANGFEQVGGVYKWTGSGVRDDVFQPHFALSVPETDDAIWSSSCASGGKVETRLYLAPPKGMKDNRATFRFETDRSAATRSYPARYVADGQYDGFAIVQPADDPMFAEMRAGQWAYIQIGEGSDAAKLRVALAGADRALGAFLPACTGEAEQAARPAAVSTTVAYACEDGTRLTASYLGNDTDTPVVRLVIDGKVELLPQTVSGSGARYEGESAGVRISWLTKADDGVLVMADAADTAGGSEQTRRCSAR